MVVLAGGFASVAAGPAVGLGRPEGGENVSLATDDVAGSKQVFKNVPRRVAWLKEKAKAAKLCCDCSFAPAMKAGFPRGAVALNPALN